MRKAAMRVIPDDQSPQINYELTIHCRVCNYKQVKGGLEAPANLSDDEVLALAQHNPRCKAQLNRNLVSVSHEVNTIDTANITNYLIQLA